MPFDDLSIGPQGLFRLDRVDDKPLPLRLPYRYDRCSLTHGHATLSRHQTLGSDGTITIILFGRTFGHMDIRQIFLEREPYDQLDERHLTFPGGWRKWRRVVRPHCVGRLCGDEIVLTPLHPEWARSGLGAIFGAHDWIFVRTEEHLGTASTAQGFSG